MSVSPYADAVLKSNPSYYWRLGEKTGTLAYDTVGGANGTISGGVTLGQPGLVADGDPAMAFDGATGKVVTANVTLPPTVTIEAWFRATAKAGSNPLLVGLAGSGDNFLLRIVGGGYLDVYVDYAGATPDAGYTATAAGAKNDGLVHQVVYVFRPSGTLLEIYIDGVVGPLSPSPMAAPFGGFTRALSIGNDATFEGSFWNSLIDEVAIYPRALPAAEILAHYAARTAAPAQNATSYAQRVIADGAVNYWRLDETSGLALDVIGGKHGTVSGGVTRSQPGALADGSKAMVFDGVTGRVSTPAVAVFTPCTIEFWMRDSGVPIQAPIVSTAYSGSQEEWIVEHSNAVTVRLYVAGQGQLTALVGTKNLRDGRWHHVAVVILSAAFSVFSDGVLDTTGVPTFPVVGMTLPLEIAFNSGNGYFHRGGLDEVALYPYALSPAQIAAHYQLGVGQFASTPQPSTPGLPLVDKVLLVGQAVLGASAGVDVAGCADLKVIVVGNGNVTGGMVLIEEAHDKDYTGTWATRAGIPAQPGTTVLAARETAKAIRARITTAVVGGSVSAYLVAR